MFYRTLHRSLRGHYPAPPKLNFIILQSRAAGIADHILPLGNWFRPEICPSKPEIGPFKSEILPPRPQTRPLRLEIIPLRPLSNPPRLQIIHLRPQSSPHRTKKTLCSTGLCPLWGRCRCPASLHSNSQSYKAGQTLIADHILPPQACRQASNQPSQASNQQKNRSPKGNMWSAIPVALLNMFVTVGDG